MMHIMTLRVIVLKPPFVLYLGIKVIYIYLFSFERLESTLADPESSLYFLSQSSILFSLNITRTIK